MYLIELLVIVAYGNITKAQLGYIEDEIKAKEYCERKTKELKRIYDKNMGYKYYQFRKLELLEA